MTDLTTEQRATLDRLKARWHTCKPEHRATFWTGQIAQGEPFAATVQARKELQQEGWAEMGRD